MTSDNRRYQELPQTADSGTVIHSTGPLGIDVVYDAEHVRKYMFPLVQLLTPDDVLAVTIHREGGDHRYEKVPPNDRSGAAE
jgi:hypothetical protein